MLRLRISYDPTAAGASVFLWPPALGNSEILGYSVAFGPVVFRPRGLHGAGLVLLDVWVKVKLGLWKAS